MRKYFLEENWETKVPNIPIMINEAMLVIEMDVQSLYVSEWKKKKRKALEQGKASEHDVLISKRTAVWILPGSHHKSRRVRVVLQYVKLENAAHTDAAGFEKKLRHLRDKMDEPRYCGYFIIKDNLL